MNLALLYEAAAAALPAAWSHGGWGHLTPSTLGCCTSSPRANNVWHQRREGRRDGSKIQKKKSHTHKHLQQTGLRHKQLKQGFGAFRELAGGNAFPHG